MFKKLFHFTIIILLMASYIKTQNKMVRKNFMYECLIQNQEYSYEYLYTNEHGKNVYVRPIGKIDNFHKIKWIIIETANHTDKYLMKNSHDDEFLCASSRFNDIFKARRVVEKFKLNLSTDKFENCFWKIQHTTGNSNSSKQTYTIINAFYNQPLYAASFLFKTNLVNRKVYLWHDKKSLNSKKFKWFIDCKSGGYSIM